MDIALQKDFDDWLAKIEKDRWSTAFSPKARSAYEQRYKRISDLRQQLANPVDVELVDAVRNFKAVKGRHNTEIACNRLYEALAAYDAKATPDNLKE